MTNARYGQICLRTGLLASVAMAIFWGVWSLFAPVPNHGTLQLTKDLAWTVPLNRWLDVVFAFALVNIYGWSLRGLWLVSCDHVWWDDFIASLGVGLGVSLVVGLVAGLKYVFSVSFWGRIINWASARDSK